MAEATAKSQAAGRPSEAPDTSAVGGRRALGQAASLLIGSFILDGVAGALHASPPTGDANDLPAIFVGIAASDVWPAAHFLQFAASLIFIAGLLVLYQAAAGRQPSLVNRGGSVLTILAAAAGAIQYAVDGVALKHAVDAWASAAPPEKAGAFRVAELARWLEWATTSYAALLLGAALVLLGITIAHSHLLPAWLGALFALSGVLDLVSGVVVGEQGFSTAATAVSAPTVILLPAATIALAVIAFRRRRAIT
ncbi:hypothetical protein ACQPX6_08215 [Actinomycetospora sp. CA-101289]|uniref:hypothetical protein n=1 Tax=Actinomycetospora sp. CA-101289 TaxID=3239893 RepID=UPI003D95F790